MSDFLKKIGVGLIVAALFFALGRYTSPSKVIVQTKTVTVEVEKEKQEQNIKTQTTETIKPDGTKVISSTTDTSTQTNIDTNINTNSSTTKETTYAKDGITLSALAGLDVTNPTRGLIYGASISRPLLGPITTGLWGMTNGTFGVSIGLKF
jgi:hypothetical protein